MKPRDLPKVRDQLRLHLTDPTSALRSGTREHLHAGFDAADSHLSVAGLYWTSEDMSALAVSAGTSLAAARWATADRPSPTGLIVFSGGVGMLPFQDVEIPVDAMSWGPYDNQLLIWCWLTRSKLIESTRSPNFDIVVDRTPPLVPILGFSVPVGGEPVSMAELDTGTPATIVATLTAAWLLMQQPQLVDHHRERADKSVRAAYGRAGRGEPEVTVVDLRRQYVPDGTDRDADASSRAYRNRWVVSGHWRDQAYGPEHSLRRQQWIPAHIKGPDGAPLLATEKVNVWRR